MKRTGRAAFRSEEPTGKGGLRQVAASKSLLVWMYLRIHRRSSTPATATEPARRGSAHGHGKALIFRDCPDALRSNDQIWSSSHRTCCHANKIGQRRKRSDD